MALPRSKYVQDGQEGVGKSVPKIGNRYLEAVKKSPIRHFFNCKLLKTRRRFFKISIFSQLPGYSVPLHLGCVFSAIIMGTV
jgi:hypothetical protein